MSGSISTGTEVASKPAISWAHDSPELAAAYDEVGIRQFEQGKLLISSLNIEGSSMKRITGFVATLGIAASSAIGSANAQSWPTRPITMVIPFAAGGGIDVFGRILGPRLGEILGTHVIIDNVGVAGGMTGAARVAKAAPDGYQLVLGNVGTHAIIQILYKSPLYTAATDFTPVALIAETPLVLVTRRNFPANNLQISLVTRKRTTQKCNTARLERGLRVISPASCSMSR